MSAKYTMQEIKSVSHPDRTVLYPKMIIEECCDGDALAELVAEGTTYNPGEVLGMFHQLCREMAGELAKGHSVKVEGLGIFTPSLALKEGKEREEADGSSPRRNATSVEVGGVNFRPDKELLAEVNRRCRLERASRQFRMYRSKYSAEERLVLARKYLEVHPVLTLSAYAELVGLGKTTAGKELRQWSEQPESGIGIEGRGAHRVYVKK